MLLLTSVRPNYHDPFFKSIRSLRETGLCTVSVWKGALNIDAPKEAESHG